MDLLRDKVLIQYFVTCINKVSLFITQRDTKTEMFSKVILNFPHLLIRGLIKVFIPGVRC